MGCSRKKKDKPAKKGCHQCQACGQVRNKSSKLCKPKKIAKLSRARELSEARAHKRKRDD